MSVVQVEIAVDSLASARAARAGGAARVELCAALRDGGLTPPADLLAAAVAEGIVCFVMIRPRPGDFVYDDAELEAMRRAIRRARHAGARGIVTGALTGDGGRIDEAAMRPLIDEAGDLPVTFHRAFDRLADLPAALEALVGLGVARVLTSGGAATATAGADAIADLVARADGRIGILPGGGVREANVRELIARTCVTEVHTQLRESFDEVVDSGRVRRFVQLLHPDHD